MHRHFLELELFSLQVLQPDVIGSGTLHFVMDRLFKRLVTGTELTDSSFNGHCLASSSRERQSSVNTRWSDLSDHICLSADMRRERLEIKVWVPQP